MKQEKDEPVTGQENQLVTDTHTLTDSETRQILTPFAFKMDHSLFGLPLAGPGKRFMAIALDLLLVGILSVMPGEILALVISVMLYRLGSKNNTQAKGQVKWRRTRSLSRFIGVFILFILLLDTLPKLLDHFEDITTKGVSEAVDNRAEKQEKVMVDVAGVPVPKELSLPVSAVMIAAIAEVALSECQSMSCWEKELAGKAEALHALELEDRLLIKTLSGLAAETDLNESEQQQLVQRLLAPYKIDVTAEKLTPAGDADNREAAAKTSEPAAPEKPVKEKKAVYSLTELLKGIIEDLGIGFGWAAFYFSCFTATWGGQTPGKKLFGIKVLQLDGTPLSLWDSFGRYGGYGAGIATGLLGFLQIFWDPNRQAIHDKISATVVIDVHKQQAEQK